MEPSWSPSPSALLDHPDIDSRMLTPSPSDPTATVLGPTLTTFPNKTFSDFLPLPNRHHHPFLLTSDAFNCSVFLRDSGRGFRFWTRISDSFRLWAQRILVAKEDVLRHQRIYSLIRLSLDQPDCNLALLGSESIFWCIGYNVFFFPCGPMSVTLRDVEAICGTHSLGEEIDGMLRPLRGMPSGIKSVKFPVFLETHSRDFGEVTDKEFVAFLLYWICKHLLCLTSKIVVEHLTLAACLAEEWPLNLSGYLLSNLYCGMYSFISCLDRGEILSHGIPGGGPMWLLQFWLHLYFPEFCFNSVLPGEATRPKICYWEELVKVRPRGMHFGECYDVFSRDTCRDDDFFVVSEVHGPVLEHHSKDWEKLALYHGNTLIPRDLPRTVKWMDRRRSYGVEVYCPHFCARQFGLCQSIPVPPGRHPLIQNPSNK